MKFQNSFWRSSGVLAVLVLESLPLQPLVAAQSPAKHKHAQRPTKQKSVAEPIWDLVITGGMVVTMDRPHRIFDKGIIVAQGDLIVAVEPSTRAAIEQYVHAAKQLIDAKGKLVLPGFINGHTHAAMTLLRGLKDDVTLEEWLTKSIFQGHVVFQAAKQGHGCVRDLASRPERRRDPGRMADEIDLPRRSKKRE